MYLTKNISIKIADLLKASSASIKIIAISLLNRIASMITAVFMARFLGKEALGEYGMIQNTVNLATTVMIGGLSTSSIHCLSLGQDSKRTGRILGLTYITTLVLAFTASIAFFLLAEKIAAQCLATPLLIKLFEISSLTVFFSIISTMQSGILNGFRSFHRLAAIDGYATLTFLLCTIVGVLSAGLLGACVGQTMGLLCSCLLKQREIQTLCQKEHITIIAHGCWSEREVLWNSAVPLTLGTLLPVPASWFISTLIAKQPAGFAALACYSVAQQWQTIILFIPTILTPMLLSMLSDSRRDTKKFRKIAQSAVIINTGLCCSLILLMILGADLILQLYGDDFRQEALLFKVTTFTALIMSLNNIAKQIRTSLHDVWSGLVMSTLSTILFLVFSYMWIEHYSILGMAYAYLAAHSVHLIGQILYYLWYKSKKNSP